MKTIQVDVTFGIFGYFFKRGRIDRIGSDRMRYLLLLLDLDVNKLWIKVIVIFKIFFYELKISQIDQFYCFKFILYFIVFILLNVTLIFE